MIDSSHLPPVCHGQVLDLPAHVVESKSVVIPLLPEGDLKAELHLHIVNLLKTSDKDIHQNLSRTIAICCVYTNPLGPDGTVIDCRREQLVKDLLLHLPEVGGWGR